MGGEASLLGGLWGSVCFLYSQRRRLHSGGAHFMGVLSHEAPVFLSVAAGTCALAHTCLVFFDQTFADGKMRQSHTSVSAFTASVATRALGSPVSLATIGSDTVMPFSLMGLSLCSRFYSLAEPPGRCGPRCPG